MVNFQLKILKTNSVVHLISLQSVQVRCWDMDLTWHSERPNKSDKPDQPEQPELLINNKLLVLNHLLNLLLIYY